MTEGSEMNSGFCYSEMVVIRIEKSEAPGWSVIPRFGIDDNVEAL